MRKLIHVIVFLLPLLLIAQDKSVIVDLSQFDDIRQIETTENFVGLVNANNEISPDYDVTLYNNTGKIFFEFKNITNYVRTIAILEKYGMFIIIRSANELFGDYGLIDKVIAYEIKSGDILWEQVSKAVQYKVSPDGSKLITSISLNGEDTSNFEVIDLLNGKKIETGLNLHYFKACWTDVDKIAIVTREFESNPGYQTSRTINKKEEINKITQSYFNAKSDFKSGKITIKQLAEKKKQMEDDLQQLNNRINENKKQVELDNRFSTPSIPKTCRIRIFSLTQKMIIQDKYVLDEVGERIIVNSASGIQGDVHSDHLGNIYIYTYSKLEQGNYSYEKSIYKINKKLECLWSSSPPNDNEPYIFYKDGDVHFVDLKQKPPLVLDDNGDFVNANLILPKFEFQNMPLEKVRSLRVTNNKEFHNRKIIFDN